jgi:hypothetical protein
MKQSSKFPDEPPFSRKLPRRTAVVSANLRYVIVWQLQCYGGILGNVGIPDNLRCVSVPAMLLTAPAQFQLAGSSVQ